MADSPDSGDTISPDDTTVSILPPSAEITETAPPRPTGAEGPRPTGAEGPRPTGAEGPRPTGADGPPPTGAEGARPIEAEAPAPLSELPQSFDAFEMSPAIRQAITSLGWQKPTPVQARTFDLIAGGHDVLVQSHTGSGKTGAFILPWLASRFEPGDPKLTGVQLLVLTPTREL